MNTKKHSLRISIVLTIIFLTIGICGCRTSPTGGVTPTPPHNYDDDFEAYGSYGKDARIVMEKIPTKIMVYGEDLYFHPCVSSIHLDSLAKDICLPRNDDGYSEYALIIHDTAGKLSLSDDDFALLNQLLDTGHYSLFYFGCSKIPEFRARDFGPSDADLGDDGAGFCLSTNEYGERCQILGLFEEAEVYHPENFTEGILSELTLIALTMFYRGRY